MNKINSIVFQGTLIDCSKNLSGINFTLKTNDCLVNCFFNNIKEFKYFESKLNQNFDVRLVGKIKNDINNSIYIFTEHFEFIKNNL